MKYYIDDIARIVDSPSQVKHIPVEHLLLDSRKIVHAPGSLFFALKSSRRDGAQYIAELYKKGVRHFIVETIDDGDLYPDANFIVVTNTLVALQQLAAWHRRQFNIPVIGITGSNGKTIVKEWLFHLLQDDKKIVRSPRSYNSQIGVPLSVWLMDPSHELGIFEAGISTVHEMETLAAIIQPTIGIFTNIGEAHNDGFSSKEEKIEEKLKLFAQKEIPVIINSDDPHLFSIVHQHQLKIIDWSSDRESSFLHVISIEIDEQQTVITVSCNKHSFNFTIPFTDEAAIENAITCCTVLCWMDISIEKIQLRMQTLPQVIMRLEYKRAINQCILINDSYSADLTSLNIALDFLDQQKGQETKTVILSDLSHDGNDKDFYPQIVYNLIAHGVRRLIGIGAGISQALKHFSDRSIQIELHLSTEEFLTHFLSSSFKEEIILLKGARIFSFERIAQLFEQKVHQTVLEINLNAVVHNVNVYKKQLRPNVKIMAMVKAFAYGSGGAEIAGVLQYHAIDYLGVAYADEGVELRNAGIVLPIMVMNPEVQAFESIVEYHLEPDLYSPLLLQSFESFLRKEGLAHYPVHIEIETGMNRLGFNQEDLKGLVASLPGNDLIRIQSVFTHLAASDDPLMDAFTKEQFESFRHAVSLIHNAIDYDVIQHISNSAAIIRMPELELDMVRLGIGMYGVESAHQYQRLLEPVATLKTTIAQIKRLHQGETVGYNRRGIISQESVIATVRIGYADGYSRRLGNGKGCMLVNGELAPVIGSVCMDMTMIDITGIANVQEGDDVIVFGKELPVETVAGWAGTIPYEILTGISQRVKRVYFEE